MIYAIARTEAALDAVDTTGVIESGEVRLTADHESVLFTSKDVFSEDMRMWDDRPRTEPCALTLRAAEVGETFKVRATWTSTRPAGKPSYKSFTVRRIS